MNQRIAKNPPKCYFNEQNKDMGNRGSVLWGILGKMTPELIVHSLCSIQNNN